MDLSLSFAARDRTFARAMRRVRPRFQPLLGGIANLSLMNPVHSAILVGLTDDQDPNYFVEMPNDDGYFQIMAGCEWPVSDDRLVRQVFHILRRAAQECPLTTADQVSVQQVFARFEKDFVDPT